VKDAEARLIGDTNAKFAWSAEQYTARPCLNAKIDALARRVIESGETLDAAPVYADAVTMPFAVSFVVRAPTRPWRFSVWEALVADGTASHFSQERQVYFDQIQSQTKSLGAGSGEVDHLSGRLDAGAFDGA
jgi:hypothetical protein